jgi:phosphatidylserine/phosphatidylglycerophosphate/cardiolipin synthase-like enzyme
MSLAFPRIARPLGFLLSLNLLVSCSGALPNDAVPDHQAERYYSVLSDTTPITALVRERGIETPDETSSVPLLEQVRRGLARSDPGGAFAGITYDLTGSNTLPTDWLVQSPTLWGRRANDLPFYPLHCSPQWPDCERDVLLPACASDADCPNGGTCHAIWAATPGAHQAKRHVCFGHSDALLLPVHDLIAGAHRFVDIAALQPAPDTRFLAALRAGLNALAASHRPIAVRVLIGQYPPQGVDPAVLLSSLVSELRDMPGARLSVSVAAMRSCTAFEACNSYSWPHAKLIAVDGRAALVGGHNLWSEDYLVDDPVHDLSMQVRGPAAASASRFVDRLWQFVCANLDKGPSVALATFANGQSKASGRCPEFFVPPAAARPMGGGVPILAVGRMGAGITTDFANQSELARDLVFGAARRTIVVSQQDIGFTLGRAEPIFPESTLDRLLDFIEQRDGHVYVVLSNAGSTGRSGSTYSNDVSLAAFARHLGDKARQRGMVGDPTVLLCSHVHLAPLRFGPDATWPDGRTIANHAKLWMVDDRFFYIGSDNLYPVNLQEFGYILDDPAAAAELRRSYWDPLWAWSQRAAVSGDGARRCIFREPSQ